MELQKALEMENAMWKAAKGADFEAFKKIVLPDAVMVCGGYRCTGAEYAEIIRNFDCKSYEIDCFEVVNESVDSFQVHYVLKMEVENMQNVDLAGTFHITTTWRLLNGEWKAVFNMDQRIA